jgi:hypothetical protein
MGAWGEGIVAGEAPRRVRDPRRCGCRPGVRSDRPALVLVHGALEDAEERRRELATQFAEYRSIRRAAPFLTVGELLERWLCAQHDWRPSTWPGVRSNVKALSADPIAGRRVATL